MTNWNAADIEKGLSVYSADQHRLGQVVAIYPESLRVRRGPLLFWTDRFYPYTAIATRQDQRLILKMSASEAGEGQWRKRPAYGKHPGDVLQTFYDRGHGVEDPFDPEQG
ncbi:hypothetical protein [Thermogemmatispora tikiterensis]|uniref:PRC-barrel domain-containing protein n=1 Tax=Thermogemmatispora tikiterensis TaxID=1825093 RepID=A0A328V9X2_9CHLR|nr:hypothetical protein [Thermogemmatispora tikiterensis]RAQ94437.1 hypothetical protein A4R35_02755 [Thermogemmatispora tikiterensis]